MPEPSQADAVVPGDLDPEPLVLADGRSDQVVNIPNALSLLRPCCEWPGRRTTENRDERAPLHSLISSAL